MADPLRKLPTEEEPDSFRYGSRWKHVRLPNGEVIDQEIPLTPEDLLDPQPGDEIPQSDPHAQIVTTLYGELKRLYESVQDVVVFFDMKIEWGIPDLPNPSPDLAIVQGLPKREGRSIYRVHEEGVLPCLIIEVVSFLDIAIYQNAHEKKVELYQRVGIPEYLIVDPPFSPKDPLALTGYRMAPDGRYRRIEPDARGHIHSETTSLFFAPSQDDRTVRVGNAKTGEWLLTASEEPQERFQPIPRKTGLCRRFEPPRTFPRHLQALRGRALSHFSLPEGHRSGHLTAFAYTDQPIRIHLLPGNQVTPTSAVIAAPRKPHPPTNGKAGGKLPSGKAALRSPARSFSAASRNAATNHR